MTNVELPLNNLSFGNVSYNLLREFYKSNEQICLFPIGNIDLSSFDSVTTSFTDYLNHSINNRYTKYSRENPCLKLWHISGAETSVSAKQNLFTFHEVGGPTPYEERVCSSQENVIFSSNYSRQKFAEAMPDCSSNLHFIPLGVDPDVRQTPFQKNNAVINFSLIGKFEKRKHTEKIIKLWLKKYGQSKRHHLNCLIDNRFMQDGHLKEILQRIFQEYGKQTHSVTFHQFLPKNSAMNQFYNFNDIDLSGLSGAEGWGLPAFNMTAIGKHSVVLAATSHLDWATKDNCLLVQPNGTEECYDNIFFRKGAPTNQGSLFTFSDDEVIAAMEEGEKRAHKVNTEGLKLRAQFTYKNTANQLLSIVKSLSAT